MREGLVEPLNQARARNQIGARGRNIQLGAEETLLQQNRGAISSGGFFNQGTTTLEVVPAQNTTITITAGNYSA